MPTFKEELARMLWLQHEGKIADDEPCKVILPRREAKKRVENKEGATRFVMDCEDPETYSAFHAEKDRYIRCAVNKSVALSIMLRAWQQLSDKDIESLAADEPLRESVGSA